MLIRVDRVAGGAGSAANTSMLPLTPVAPASSRAKRYVLCASWAPVPNPPGSKLGGYGGVGLVGSESVLYVAGGPFPPQFAWAPGVFSEPVPSSGTCRLMLLRRPYTRFPRPLT